MRVKRFLSKSSKLSSVSAITANTVILVIAKIIKIFDCSRSVPPMPAGRLFFIAAVDPAETFESCNCQYRAVAIFSKTRVKRAAPRNFATVETYAMIQALLLLPLPHVDN